MAGKKISRDSAGKVSTKVSFLNTFKTYQLTDTKQQSIKNVTDLQKILRCRNQANSQYYLTTGKGLNSRRRDVLLEESPYNLTRPFLEESFKTYYNIQETNQQKVEVNLKYMDRNNSKSRQVRDIRDRNYIPPDPDNVRTVRDMDQEFFSIVEGRPINYDMDKTDYINSINESNQNRMTTGYQLDMVYRIMDNLEFEKERYNETLAKLTNYEHSFEEFMMQDFSKSMRIMKEQKDFAKKLRDKNEEYQMLGAKWGDVRRRLYTFEDRYLLLKSFRNFLYMLSPEEWLLKNCISKITLEKSIAKLPPPSSSFLHIVDPRSAVYKDSLELIIDAFNQDRIDFPGQELYFKNPKDLWKILKRLLNQNMDSWANAENLSKTLSKLRRSKQITMKHINEDLESFQGTIDNLEKDSEQEEKRAAFLKCKTLRIISTSFFNVVASEETMLIDTCLRDVYGRLISELVSFSPLEMMKALQVEYGIVMNSLNELDFKMVKQAKKDTYSHDIVVMKKAEEAAYKLKNLERIQRKLRFNLIGVI